MIAAVLLSLVALLPGQLSDTIIPGPNDPVWEFPDPDEDEDWTFIPIPAPLNPDFDWDEVERDCEDDPECIRRRRALEEQFGSDFWQDDDWDDDDGDSGPPPTSCEPRDPSRPEPDVMAMPKRVGEIIHEAGDGPVVTGMDTEFRWEGPDQISWTQPAVPGLREDCTLVPGEAARFTASVDTILFDFETGDRKLYELDREQRVVTHRYEEAGRWTVCVYVVYEIPGEGFTAVTQVAELDHDVVEARGTLLR